MDNCFDSLTARLRLAVPDAPIDLLESYKKHAIRHFFQKSLAWMERIHLPVKAGVCDYVLSSSADVVKIHAVKSACGKYISDWEHPYPRMITLLKPFDGDIVVEASLSSNEPPEDVVEANIEAIESIALSNIFMLPNKPFTSPDLAIAHRNIAENIIANAKKDSLRNMKPYRKTYGYSRTRTLCCN